MKFFKPEDFYTPGELSTMRTPQEASDIANAKLDHEGKRVYRETEQDAWWEIGPDSLTKETALVINIEPLKKCGHPKEKVTKMPYSLSKYPPSYGYVCECGARVEIATYKGVGE